MDSELHKPYKKIQAAEEQLEINTLLDSYVALYKKKFRGEPLVDLNPVHTAQIKQLKKLAKDKAHFLLSHYFAMNDPWFIQQAYSLDCLMKNLHKVHADYSKRHSVNYNHEKCITSVNFWCESCWKDLVVQDKNFPNGFYQCEECKTAKRPMRLVSKEERRVTILKYGNMFPDLPVDSEW